MEHRHDSKEPPRPPRPHQSQAGDRSQIFTGHVPAEYEHLNIVQQVEQENRRQINKGHRSGAWSPTGFVRKERKNVSSSASRVFSHWELRGSAVPGRQHGMFLEHEPELLINKFQQIVY